MARRRIETEETLRERAFNDYVMLGPRRSVNMLFEIYKETAAEHGGASVPTLNRPTLYRWSKEDSWEQMAQEIDRKAIESDRRNYEQVRRQRMDDLADLSRYAIASVSSILKKEVDGVTPAHLLRASELVLDRFGINAKNANRTDQESDEGILSPEEVATLEEFYHELVNNR